MKITNLSVGKEQHDGKTWLVCRIDTNHGAFSASAIWHNTLGLWASDSDEREPAEIAATLRCFAKAIEDEANSEKVAARAIQ